MTTEQIPNGPVASTPDAAFAEQDATAAAGAAKLKAMLGVDTLPPLPGAKTTAAPPKPAEPSAAEKRVQELNANPALWDPKHQDNARLRKELREAIAASATDQERLDLANETPADLRSRFGIEDDPTKTLPHPALRERWDSEAEAVGLASLANWGVAADVARDAHTFVVQRGIANMGAAATEADYEAFAEKFKGRLSDGQIAALVEWHRGLGAS